MKNAILATALALAGTAFAPHVTNAQETLRLGHYFPTEDFRGRTAQYFADRLNETSDEVNVEIYPNESLVKGREALQATSQGVVDIYSVYAGYLSGQLPIINIFSLPFPPVSYDDKAMFELARAPETVKLLDESFAEFGVKYLGVINSSGPATIFLRDPVEDVADVSGRKLRGAGGLSNDALTKLGASVVLLSAAEQFLALQTGTVDGIVTTYSSYVNYGLAEVAPTFIDANVVRAPYLLLMNKAKYDALSDDARAALDAAVVNTATWSQENFDAEQEELLAQVKSSAQNIVQVTPEQQAKLRDEMQPIYNGFITDNGAPAEELMQRWNSIVNDR